jgi:hypothetical protein
MDGAWALYEAWVKFLTGEAEIALAYGFGKSSATSTAAAPMFFSMWVVLSQPM